MPSSSRTKVPTSKTPEQPAPAAKQGKKRKLDPNAQKYYAVRAGIRPGVYLTWKECQAQTAGFKGAVYKSFLNREDAVAFIAGKNPSTASDGTKEERFYAVAVGRDPGVYTDWETASLAIKGWKGPKFKKFDTRAEAIEFIRTHGNEEAQKYLEDEGITTEPPKKKSRTSTITLEEDEEEDDDDDELVHIFTDGSSRSNGRAGASAGVGVYFGPNDSRNVSERLEGEPQTNQRAELTAILRALEKVEVEQPVRIYSDSKYSISCVTDWYRNWAKNGWKTKEGAVKNRDLVEAIRAKIDERDEAGTDTLFQWVKGHAENKGNVAADLLAVQGSKLK